MFQRFVRHADRLYEQKGEREVAPSSLEPYVSSKNGWLAGEGLAASQIHSPQVLRLLRKPIKPITAIPAPYRGRAAGSGTADKLISAGAEVPTL